VDVDAERDGESLDEVLDLRPRRLSAEERCRFEGYAAEILSALGLDLATPGTEDTPRRFIQALLDATDGYDGDPKLRRFFAAEPSEESIRRNNQIVEGPIPFFSLCEHHALPFHGRAYVGYVAGDQIVGLSKLTRLVRLFARRFNLQERLGNQIADALDALIEPRGVAVYLEAEHLCGQMRGVREAEALTRTTVWRGAYDRDPSLRSEFLATCALQK
jgi:GTP cyclohydrolase I